MLMMPFQLGLQNNNYMLLYGAGNVLHSMESEISVIQYSASINNAFISTVDHLPCDVIRSLWLLQSCNVASDTFKAHLNQLMLDIQNDPVHSTTTRDTISKMISLKEKIRNLDSEALQESRALYNQLLTHRTSLMEELNQLKSLGKLSMGGSEIDSCDTEQSETSSRNTTAAEKLKQQLLEHYSQNPLRSQVEAMKEQEEKRKAHVAAQAMSEPHPHLHLKLKKKSKALVKPSIGPKVKLILKIPQKGKKVDKSKSAQGISAPKHEKVAASKREIEPEPKPEAYVEPEDTNLYCFCKQPSLGDMIGCDNEHLCPNGDWFHYKCVGLLSKAEAMKYSSGKEKWFCSDGCRVKFDERKRRKKKKSRKW